MKFISLFSGIGGFDLGFERAGMECVTQVEFDPKARGVLAAHWPAVKQLEDVRNVGKHNLATVDLICGGFPCQDVSVAGRRAGLAGERSGLWFEFLRIVTELAPRWVVIENVPGLLSSNRGRDFATILDGLVKCGYGVGWRVLDSQHFGLAQRRKRVFIVAGLASAGCNPAQVLFERESGGGNYGTSEAAGKRIATASASGVTGYRKLAHAEFTADDKTSPVLARDYKSASDLVAYNITFCDTNGRRQDRLNGGLYVNETEQANTLNAGDPGEKTVIAFDRSKSSWQENITGPLRVGGAISEGVNGGKSDHWCVAIDKAYAARRLTPTECERLQGFPDSWTAVNEQSDSARYKQLGNAVSVPVAEWLGKRLMQIEVAS